MCHTFLPFSNHRNDLHGVLTVLDFTVCPVQVKAMADVSVAGRGSSSVHVSADGKDRVMLNTQMSHFLKKGDRAVGLRLNISQSLLPSATDLHVNMAANVTADRFVHHHLFLITRVTEYS